MRTSLRLDARGLIPVLALVSMTAGPVRGGSDAGTSLQQGVPIERRLSGTDTHTYSVPLRRNEVLKLEVDQRGVDVVVRLLSPTGQRLRQWDGPTGSKGLERVHWLAQEPGTYRVSVTPLLANAKEGRYEIRLVEVRPANLQELERAKVEAEIARLEKEWDDAHSSADVEAVDRLAADDYINFAPEAGGSVNDKKQLLESVAADREQRKRLNITQKNTLEDVTVRLAGDTAVVTGLVTITLVQDGKETPIPRRFTHVWAKQDGKWRVIGDQTFSPVQPPQPRTIAQIAPEILDAYAGRYELMPGATGTIRREGDHLVLEGQEGKVELYPETETDFFAKDVDLQLTFIRDARGQVTSMLMTSQGRPARLRRVP